MSLDLKILRRLFEAADGFIIEAEEEEESSEKSDPKPEEAPKDKPKPGSFEDDPMGFILRKYVSLNEILSELMTPSFRDYVDGIFIVAPKPTTFKILLHNGQYFFLTYLGKAYEATIAGRNYYLIEIGEKERSMMAISRLLRFGSPLKTKGPEGAEQATRDEEGGDGGEEVDTTAEEGGEELTENIEILKAIIKKSLLNEAEKEQKKSVLFETALVLAWSKINKKNVPKGAVGESDASLVKQKYPELINKAEQALIATELTGGSGAKSTGKLTEPLTPFWTSHGATNKTSKSDVIIGDTRISVKAGPSQLMSGVSEEATATFYAALKKTPKLLASEEVQAILASIKKFAKGGRTSGNIRQALKTGEDKKLLIANKANKKAMALITVSSSGGHENKISKQAHNRDQFEHRFSQRHFYEASESTHLDDH